MLRLLLLLLACSLPSCYRALDGAAAAVTNPTCSLKDNCNLGDNLLAVATGGGDNVDPVETHIASIFEDKVNYSLKLFADDATASAGTTATAKTTTTTTVVDVLHDALAGGNLSELHHQHHHIHHNNFTLRHFSDKQRENEDEDQTEEDEEQVYLYNIGKRFLAISQPFDAARNPDATPLCRLQMRRYLKALNNFDLWALKMHDASGKLNSGILNGNINQPGDFDQCMGIQQSFDDVSINDDGDGNANGRQANSMIRGQYCLAYAQPVLPHKSKRLQAFFKLLQSHGPFKSEFNDPGHRVPRYSLINWGICVPSGCTHRDVEFSVAEYLRNQTAATGISFNVRVEPQMCQVRDPQPWDRNTTWAVRFFVLVLCLAVLSTVYDRSTKTQPKQNKWCTAFSLDKNLRWLFSTRSSPGDIEAVHGIRFLNAMMLIFSHKSMAMFFNPYNNRTAMSESLGQPWTVIGRAASLYTDPFLLFSGMLTSYSLFGRLMKQQPIRLKNEYISRLMRIVPPLAALILFCTYVLPLWGSGPQWNLVVGHHADICKQHWWRNLLFIHNYFGFSEMCLTHTHHLGIDTELFAVAPLFILALWRWPRRGLFALLFLCTVGTAARYYTTIVNQLSNYIYFGTNIQRLFRTADYMYSFPPHRSTVYIMGILLGYVLRKNQGAQLTSLQLRLGWLAATICVLASLLGPAPMGDINYVYNSTHAAIYAAFAPIAWCLFFSWIVFVSHNGYKNKLTKLFAWRGFQVSTKLSYAIYLTQFPVFFFNVGRRRHIHHYYNFVSVILDTNEFISIFLASVALTVLFDAPFQNLKKLIISSSSSSVTKPKTLPAATTTAMTTTTTKTPSTQPNGTASHPHQDQDQQRDQLQHTHSHAD